MKWIGLAGFLAASFATAGVAGWLTAMGMPEWYMSLQKPAWNPPSWLFGPVWTALYIAMAVAAWLVWKDAGFSGAPAALAFFFAQLVLNMAWSGVFFALRSPGWALAEILVLWVTILVTTMLFFRHSTWAGALMIPYLVWVAFASALSAAIARLN